jgi:hypothetical protein
MHRCINKQNYNPTPIFSYIFGNFTLVNFQYLRNILEHSIVNCFLSVHLKRRPQTVGINICCQYYIKKQCHCHIYSRL